MTIDITPSPTGVSRGKYFCIPHEVVDYMVLVEEEPGIKSKAPFTFVTQEVQLKEF